MRARSTLLDNVSSYSVKCADEDRDNIPIALQGTVIEHVSLFYFGKFADSSLSIIWPDLDRCCMAIRRLSCCEALVIGLAVFDIEETN